MDLLQYDAQVVKNGNSMQVVIPSYLIKNLQIDKGDNVTMKLISVKKSFEENKRAVTEFLTPQVCALVL